MMEKLGEVARHWHDQFASSLLFALVGIFIGIGQLLTGNERLTARLLLGRAMSTGGLAMAAGKSFDGHEDAQNRMARAITGMEDTDEILWVLADNTPAMVGKTELKEALRLAGQAQTAVWVKPYQPA